eukprot:jgi/Phyca11/20336/fgenesh1_pg.PHYCAscaffold_62_\
MRSETSFVYDWGVRVVSMSDASAPAVWMYLASETCRTQRERDLMSAGKTSKATHHLSTSHDIGSDKIASEVGKKMTREEELASLRSSPLFRDDTGRAYVLIETLRIVNNSLPFRIGEYVESLLICDLMLKEEDRVSFNAKVIRHPVIALYDATTRQRRIVKTVYQTQHVEVMGTRSSELCSVMTEQDINSKQLLNFRIHRFLGLARVVRRILLLWDPLVAWYEERAAKAQRENLVPPAAFPLMREKLELIQLLLHPNFKKPDDLMELFAETADVPPPADTHNAMHEQRIDEELDRWLMSPTTLRTRMTLILGLAQAVPQFA